MNNNQEQVCENCKKPLKKHWNEMGKGDSPTCKPFGKVRFKPEAKQGRLRPLRECPNCGLGQPDSHVCKAEPKAPEDIEVESQCPHGIWSRNKCSKCEVELPPRPKRYSTTTGVLRHQVEGRTNTWSETVEDVEGDEIDAREFLVYADEIERQLKAEIAAKNELATKLNWFTDNPRVGSCSICSSSIWRNESRIEDSERGLFHPICDVGAKLEKAEKERDETREELGYLRDDFLVLQGERDAALEEVKRLDGFLTDANGGLCELENERDQLQHWKDAMLAAEKKSYSLRPELEKLLPSKYLGKHYLEATILHVKELQRDLDAALELLKRYKASCAEMKKLIQLFYYQDLVIGLDSDGDMWKINFNAWPPIFQLYTENPIRESKESHHGNT